MTDVIVSALGFKLSDLFPSHRTEQRIIKTYDYTDEASTLLFQTVRFEPKKFKQRRPDPKQPDKWIWDLKGIRRVLFRLPEVISAAKNGRTIFIAEGEKDVDSLVEKGFAATCNPMGAGKWLTEYTETLRGATRVVIVVDKDEPGRRHAEAVAASSKQITTSIRLIELPDRNGQSVKDASDWFSAGGTAEELQELVEATQDFAPASALVPPLKYLSPPLDLFPPHLRDYVCATAKSLGVDVAFTFLPLLSALAAAIGNSRSIIIKNGFVQPAILWTTLIARSGSKKSPALSAICSFFEAREKQLQQSNAERREQFEKELLEWEKNKDRENRGPKPKPPLRSTCLLDDLTLAVVALILSEKPRGALVAKDELASWLGSFGQFSKTPGGAASDVSGWLSLFNGERLFLDRKTNRESHRIFNPRLSIAGCIPPSVLKGALTKDFFQRGLPARILFAAPPPRVNTWTDSEVPAHLEAGYAETLKRLFALTADANDYCEAPRIIRVSPEALDVFVEFYNRVGNRAIDAEENEEAAWSKLTGGAARLALIGHLANGFDAEPVGAQTMQSATELATWFGHEAERIYAAFSESPETSLHNRLVEFIERRGGSATVSEIAHNFRPLKNKSEQIEQLLNQLVKSHGGEWLQIDPGKQGGRPTRQFSLLGTTATPCPLNLERITENRGFKDRDSRGKPPEPPPSSASTEDTSGKNGLEEVCF